MKIYLSDRGCSIAPDRSAQVEVLAAGIHLRTEDSLLVYHMLTEPAGTLKLRVEIRNHGAP